MQTRYLLFITTFVVFVFSVLVLGISTTFAAVGLGKDMAASPDAHFQTESITTEEQRKNKEEEEEEPDC